MAERIYLLEDDDSIRKLVVYALESQGYEAVGFSEPESFWKALENHVPSLILLDIMLPEEDGISILRRLRAGSVEVPVIMLTAKNSEYDRVEGLDAGADDYISKPFGILELTARVRAVLRRSSKSAEEPLYEERVLRCGPLGLFPERRVTVAFGRPVELTFKEFSLLELLLENQGRVLTREILMDRIWGMEADRENRTLDVHIRSLRSKLGEAGGLIRTVRGVGYKLAGEEP